MSIKNIRTWCTDVFFVGVLESVEKRKKHFEVKYLELKIIIVYDKDRN